MTEIVCARLDHGIVAAMDPLVHADDLGLTRGDGCFEGLRIYRIAGGYAIAELTEHLNRMAHSADALGIAFSRDPWCRLIEELGSTWAQTTGDDEGMLKLVLTRGREGAGMPTGFATVTPIAAASLRARERGVRVATLSRGVTSDAFADSPWLLGGAKLLSYAINMAAQREAQRRGEDEAIFVTTDGALMESPSAAIVWAKGDVLNTVTPGANGILRSITTETLMRLAPSAGLQPAWTTGRGRDLHDADLVMLVSSGRGDVRITAIDDVTLATSPDSARLLRTCQELLGFTPVGGQQSHASAHAS